MSFLRKLADSGKTVIAVIHQPSQHVFAMFDDLLLVSEGRLMYYGETSKVRSHLANLGHACPQDVGTAEHVLDCISRANGGPEQRKESDERLNHLAENAAGLVESLSLNDEGAKDGSQRRHKSLMFMGQNKSRRSPAANIIRQFRLLLGRSLRETFRGKASLIIKVVQQIMLATIYGGIYKLKDNQVRAYAKSWVMVDRIWYHFKRAGGSFFSPLIAIILSTLLFYFIILYYFLCTLRLHHNPRHL